MQPRVLAPGEAHPLPCQSPPPQDDRGDAETFFSDYHFGSSICGDSSCNNLSAPQPSANHMATFVAAPHESPHTPVQTGTGTRWWAGPRLLVQNKTWRITSRGAISRGLRKAVRGAGTPGCSALALRHVPAWGPAAPPAPLPPAARCGRQPRSAPGRPRRLHSPDPISATAREQMVPSAPGSPRTDCIQFINNPADARALSSPDYIS